jgi:hypothetical protein
VDDSAAMLPAIPAALTDDLPALDRERLATFDEQIAELVEAARQHGFSDATVRSVLAARERLYAERGAAWRHLVLYGVPLISVERFAGDERAARAWVRERLGVAVQDHVADTLRTGRPGGRDRRYKPMPHFEAWMVDRDVDVADEEPGEAVVRAYTQYAGWLDAHGDAVVSEAERFLARQPQTSLYGSVLTAARAATADFHAVTLGEFDELFAAHIQRGIRQVRASDPLPPPPTDRRSLLERLADRVLATAPTVVEDRKGLEYRALSDFFDVAAAMSSMVGSFEGAPQVTQIVDQFKRVVGLDALEAAVLGTAKARLDALVNRETAFAFLSRFDHQVRRGPSGQARKPRPDRSAASATAAGEGPGEAASSPDPVTFTAGASGTSVTFTRAALDDDAWAGVLYDKVAEMLEALIAHHLVTRGFVKTLCRESHDLLTPPDSGDGGRSLDKRVLRRLALRFHPDARLGGDERTDTDEMNARTLSRLLALHRDGRFEIRAAGDTVVVLTRAQT